MPESKRQCSTCIFFRSAQLSGNGWCTHPQRQLASDVKILVRERELACRNTWGDDLWVDASSPATTSTPAPQASRGITYLNTRQDDEVTSVVDATDRARAIIPTEDTITMTSIRAEGDSITPPNDALHDTNSAAVADQEERARVMARGSRDAIISARKRHVQRRQPRAESPLAESAASNQDVVLSAQSGASAPVASDEQSQQAVPSPAVSDRQPPRVTPEVDLPRLRSFLLNTDEAPIDTPPQSFTTHFDHVLNQAEKIKERAIYEPVAKPERPISPPPAHKAGRAESLVGQANTTVNSPSRLDMTFARARAAIYRPTPPPVMDHQIDPVEESSSFDDAMEQAASPRDVVSFEQVDVTAPLQAQQHDGDFDMVQLDGADVDSAFEDDDLRYELEPDMAPFVAAMEPEINAAAEEVVFNASQVYADEVIPADTPSRSLWRSFNFGFKRRYKPAPEVQYDDEEEWSYQATDDTAYLPMEDETAGVWAENDLDASDEDDWAYAASAYEEDESDDAYTNDVLTETAPARSRPSMYVSSEESWELDLREFPEPQPVEWHETRSELLSRLEDPVPMVAAQQWEDASYLDDVQDEVSWMYPEPFQYADPEPEPARPLPPRRAFMDLDQAAGMDAFRDALFGSEPVAPTYVAPVRTEARSTWVEPTRPYPEDRERSYRETRSEDVVYEPAPIARREPERRKSERTRTPRQAHEPARAFPDLAEPDIRATAEPSVAKSCLTCRSFQPSEDRERGWCTNVHASTHRQMVNSSELACRSSIGDWWIRNDASWLPPESRIQPSTPHSDQLAASAKPREDDQTRQGRGVRTRKSG